MLFMPEQNRGADVSFQKLEVALSRHFINQKMVEKPGTNWKAEFPELIKAEWK